MKSIYFFIISLILVSCSPKEAEPIVLNVDQCHHCKMNIAHGKFGAELITKKGRIYKFDDIFCMVNFHQQNLDTEIQNYYIHDYAQNNVLIPAETAFYCKGGAINSPMHGNIIATTNKQNVLKYIAEFQANAITWDKIINSK